MTRWSLLAEICPTGEFTAKQWSRVWRRSHDIVNKRRMLEQVRTLMEAVDYEVVE